MVGGHVRETRQQRFIPRRSLNSKFFLETSRFLHGMLATTEGMGAQMMTQQGAWGLAGLGLAWADDRQGRLDPTTVLVMLKCLAGCLDHATWASGWTYQRGCAAGSESLRVSVDFAAPEYRLQRGSAKCPTPARIRPLPSEGTQLVLGSSPLVLGPVTKGMLSGSVSVWGSEGLTFGC